jgi:transcription-repair coupling factor (superfamily II helicase)
LHRRARCTKDGTLLIVKKPTDVLQLIAEAPPMRMRLAAVRKGEAIAFEHVFPAARPTLAALIARAVTGRLWIVCETISAQEALHNELLHWCPDALFYPEADIAPVEGAVADPENVAERLAVVQRLGDPKARELVLVLTRRSLDERVPTVESLSHIEITLKRGKRLDRENLLKQLAYSGYEHVPQVTARGQFAVRGGILDIYSFHHALPARVELFDDEIESLRHFDLDAQTSVQQVEAVTLLLGDTASAPMTCLLQELIGDNDVTIDAGADWLAAQVRLLESAELSEQKAEDYSCAFFDHGLGEFSAGDFLVDEIKRERFFDQLSEWRRDGWHVHVFCNNEGEIERLRELVPPVEADALHFSIGPLSSRLHIPRGESRRAQRCRAVRKVSQ